MKTGKIITIILMLVLLDQMIKIVIYNYFFDHNFVIIPPLFEFRPVFNNKGPYFFNLLKINIGYGIFIIHIILQFCMITFYILLRQVGNNTKLFDSVFIFFESGLICSLIGYLIWDKGCLDYIYLKPLFIFDLKDVYINCFVCLLLIFSYKNKLKRFSYIRKLLKTKHLL